MKVKHLPFFLKISVVILFFLENLKPLLPAGIQDKLHTLIPCQKFDLSYNLNYHKLCSDFQEDIVFHFSLGWSSLVHRFLGPRNAQRVLLGLSEPIFQVCIFESTNLDSPLLFCLCDFSIIKLALQNLHI